MKLSRRLWISATAVLGVMTVAAVVAPWEEPSPWFAPADQPRNTAFSRKFAPAAARPLGLPVSAAPFEGEVTVEQYPNGVWIESDPVSAHGSGLLYQPPGTVNIDADATNLAVLPDGSTLRLAGMQLLVPGSSPSGVLDPRSLQPVPSPLDQDFPPLEKANYPVVRLIFEGTAAVRVRPSLIRDRRTDWMISRNARPAQLAGARSCQDVILATWTDSPASVAVTVPFGTPSEDEVPLTAGVQIATSQGVRFQFAASGEGIVDSAPFRWSFWEVRGTNGSFAIGRVSPAFWATQCSLRWRGALPEDERWFQPSREGADFQGVSLPWMPKFKRGSLILRVYPQQAQVKFRLEGLPGMPGKRSLRNLFLTPIPEVTIENDGDYLQHAAMATHLHLKYGPGVFGSGIVRSYSEGVSTSPDPFGPKSNEPLILRDVTPEKLVQLHLQVYPSDKVSVNLKNGTLDYPNGSDPTPWEKWWRKVTKWWSTR